MASLALLHIHYDKQIDVDWVVDIYSHLHSRRMELKILLMNLIRKCAPSVKKYSEVECYVLIQ